MVTLVVDRLDQLNAVRPQQDIRSESQQNTDHRIGIPGVGRFDVDP